MKLNNIAANQTEITLAKCRVFFSYDTPVAGYGEFGAFRTSETFSRTTSKHIRAYLGSDFDDAAILPQGMIAAQLKYVGDL